MKKNKSKGLGDTIEKIVEKVSEVTGKDCGCAKRQDTLNKLFPYNYIK